MKTGAFFLSFIMLLGIGLAGCTSYDDDVVPVDLSSKLELVNDEFMTVMNKPVKLTVLDNDKIGGNGSLTFRAPANGSVQVQENDFYYVPNPNFTGSDRFIYRYCMTSSGACDSATVTILVN